MKVRREGRMTPKKIVFFFLKLGFITALFVLIFRPETYGFREDMFHNISPASLWESLREVELATAIPWLIFAATVKLLGIFAGIIRWRILLRGQGIQIPFWYLTKCWFWGRAIGLWLPGTLGLDGYRLVESARHTGEVIKCTTVIAVEKLTGFIALFTLVFLTLPLGMGLLDFKPALLIAVLTVLGGFIVFTMTLLMQPRIIQVMVAVLPVPGTLRHKVNKLGHAVTAYGDKRGSLLIALAFGLCVHLGIVLMFFGTMSAIGTENVSIGGIFFASPLIIVGSVLTPTVSGLGVRETVMTYVFGATAGAEKAFLFGHLGLWFGEVVPLILSVPLLLSSRKPDREEVLEELKHLREVQGLDDEEELIPASVIREYRKKVAFSLLAGVCAGLVCGAVIGLSEAYWHTFISEGLLEWSVFWWAPLVYGIVFAGVGLGIAGGLVFLYLLFDRFAPTAGTFGLSAGAILALAALAIGRFRYVRDVLEEHAPSMTQNLGVLGAAVGIGVVGALLGVALVTFAGRRGAWKRSVFATAVVYVALVLGGAAYGAANVPEREVPVFADEASGKPNIILIAVDTLRADYLPMYRPDTAPAKTPNLEKFTQDAVLFEHAFAQSSWTKASFGTIFTGMYPEAHTATGKASALPDDVVTIAEVLRDGGYFTRGFSNNPNITSTFNYNQGFLHYTDLKPNLLLGAQPSSEKLVVYDILRKVYQVVTGKLFKQRIVITDFYQPADEVTDKALEWIDSTERPEHAPFLLFTHYMDPHDPYRDPERPGKGYARVQMGDPDPDEYKEAFIRSYCFEVEFMDTHVGRLLDGLKSRGLYDNTLIVFTSDHGEEFCEHGAWWHGLSLYDEQIAVPLIIKLPANLNGGRRNTFLARHVDLGPTLVQEAGLSKPESMIGYPLFLNDYREGNFLVKDTFAELDFESIVLQAIRTKAHKLIKSNENKRNYAPVELYDLVEDPGEQNNLAGEAPSIETELLKLVDTAMERAKADAVQSEQVDLNDLSDQLDSLGYGGSDDTED